MKKFKVTETIYYMSRTKTYTHEGTLEDLIKNSKYTFEIGESYNPKINTNPKTIKSYVSILKKALGEKHCCAVDVSYIEI